MTPTLGAVINEAYRVFGDYTIGDALVVCHCNCCMTEETQRELIATPLRQISASLLAEYTNSAHGWDDAQIAREMRYFLPRYFELIALHDPPHTMGLDICLRRLGYTQWRLMWPPMETAIIERFFDALLVALLARLDLAHWPGGLGARLRLHRRADAGGHGGRRRRSPSHPVERGRRPAGPDPHGGAATTRHSRGRPYLSALALFGRSP
jgi:hypothetical protein